MLSLRGAHPALFVGEHATLFAVVDDAAADLFASRARDDAALLAAVLENEIKESAKDNCRTRAVRCQLTEHDYHVNRVNVWRTSGQSEAKDCRAEVAVAQGDISVVGAGGQLVAILVGEGGNGGREGGRGRGRAHVWRRETERGREGQEERKDLHDGC